MATLLIETAEEALEILDNLELIQGIESVTLGVDFGLTVKIDGGYHSEMPARVCDEHALQPPCWHLAPPHRRGSFRAAHPHRRAS